MTPSRKQAAPIAALLLLTLQFPATAAGGPPSAPTATQAAAPKEWESVFQSTTQLSLDNKYVEAIAAMTKFLARYPNFGDAQFHQARLYEQVALAPGTSPADQKKNQENAVRHYLRAADLMTDRDAQFLITWKLVQLNDEGALNKPADAEKYARRLASEHGTRPESHMILARMLHERGDIAGAADVMRKGRATAIDPPTIWSLTGAQYLIQLAETPRDRPRDETQRLLDEAIGIIDAILPKAREDQQEYRLVTMARAMALDLMAERVEQDRQRRIALLLEAERYGAPIDKHVKRTPPPARKLTAAQTVEFEWDAISKWSSRLADEGRFRDGIAMIDRYIASYPNVPHTTYATQASMYVRWADTMMNDAKMRTALLERALVPAQRVIGLSPTQLEREEAFAEVIRLLGPSLLNRPEWIENACRTQARRYPMDSMPHAILVLTLFRAERAAEADAALLAARKGMPSTALARASLASNLLWKMRSDPPNDLAQRNIWAAAAALVTEAEKMNPNIPEVLEARASTLRLQSDLEADPAKKKALIAQAEQQLKRAIALRTKK